MIDDPLNKTKVKRGEALAWSKLTENDVLLIRATAEHRQELKRQASQISNRKLAEKFGVHERTIDKIVAGYIWSHI